MGLGLEFDFGPTGATCLMSWASRLAAPTWLGLGLGLGLEA